MYLTPQEMNAAYNEVLANHDVVFRTREQALQFINSKFPDFPQELAGFRGAEGWHFDEHPLIGSGGQNIQQINIYSKRFHFRVHITWLQP